MTFDVLAAGELLVDFISTATGTQLGPTDRFQPFPGGSPANLGSNLRRLGISTGLLSTVGKDDLGNFLFNYIKGLGLDISAVQQVDTPSTIILLTRSQGVPKFEAYRSADKEITMEQLSVVSLSTLKLFHTTCFGLSQEPARSTILFAAKAVARAGGHISIDTNYAAKVWPDRSEAQAVVKAYCQLGALVKCSDVDWERLYGSPMADPAQAVQFFHNLGAKLVCLTLGPDGCVVSNQQELVKLPVRPIKVVDTTGAGDAFWAGFLSAFLKNESLKQCATKGRALAEMKLQQVGPLPAQINYEDLI